MHRIPLFALLIATAIACRDAEPIAPSTDSRRSGSSAVYEAVDIGTLGGAESFAAMINTAGQVVGWSQTADGATHAFLWQDGEMRDLGTLGGDFSTAVDINDVGQVAGHSTTAGGDVRAFLWSEGVMQDLGPRWGHPLAGYPARLNNAGQVTWTAAHPDGTRRAFLWSEGAARDLGTLGGGYSDARAINNRGHIVGASDGHAFLWDGQALRDLGWLGNNAYAADINEHGQVVGASATPQYTLHALLWDDGQMIDLGTLPGDPNAHAVAITEQGVVVGVSLNLNYEGGDPFRWRAGVLSPLNSAQPTGARTETVVAMNERELVVGNRTLNRVIHAVITEDGLTRELPGLGDFRTHASAINARGDVVGSRWLDEWEGIQHAVLWRRVQAVAAAP